jgi:hypothetical protein
MTREYAGALRERRPRGGTARGPQGPLRARRRRGREDAAPVAIHFGVVGAVGALVLVILVVALLLWVLIR